MGGFLADVTVPFKVRRGLNEAAHISFTTEHEDDTAYLLLDELTRGIPQIACYRDGVLWARGWWHPMEETAGQDTTSMGCVFRGPFAELETTAIDQDYKSGLAADGSFLPVTADQAAHAVALVTWNKLFAAGRLDNQTGLRVGQQAASMVRERTYAKGKNIAEAILQLTEVQGGIEFLERPVAALTSSGVVVLAEFDVGGPARFGTDKSASVIFEHGFGASNASSVSRQISPPVNRVQAFGAEVSLAAGSAQQIYQTRLRRVSQHEASIAKYGPKEITLDLPDASFKNLIEHADGALRPDPVQAVTFQPDASGDLQPWTSYWLGDTVRLIADRDALQIDMTARVRAIEVAVDEDANETHTLEIGDQRASPLVDVLRSAGRVARGLARADSRVK